MVELTKLDGRKIFLNIDTVKYLEQAPHTIVHLINGDTIIVKETPSEIAELLIQFKGRVLQTIEAQP